MSIHALREEGDLPLLLVWLRRWNFYPRPPRGGRLLLIVFISLAILFLSTPSARRATALYVDQSLLSEISIHALREEGDLNAARLLPVLLPDFYPRPPRGGRLL